MAETVTLEPEIPVDLPPQDLSEEELQKRLQIQVVDLSHGVVENARDHAAEHINRETTEGRNGFTRFVKRIWHGNLARDYYTVKEQQRARQEITESGNLYAMNDAAQDTHDRAAAAVVQRVAEGFIHEESGETQKALAEVQNGAHLESQLKELVKSYANGDLDHESLVEEKTRLISEFGRGLRKEDRNKGLLFGDNIVEVANHAKTALAYGLGLDRIDAALSAKHADVKMGARTEVRLNAVERATNALYKTRLGSALNETTLATLVSIPFIAGKFATRKVISAGAAVVSLGAGSALIAGARESLHINQDRQTHMREMATGGGEQLARAGKRRDQMEATRYATVAASELLAGLGTARESAGAGEDGLRSALDAVVLARTLVSQSDEKSADFIAYSDKTNVESERLGLDIGIADARAAVQTALTEADDGTLTALGIASRELGTVLDERTSAVLEQLNGDVGARDQAFRKLQRSRVLKAAAVGFVSAEVIGLGIQEIKAELSDSLQGVFEDQADGQTRRTLLAGIFRDHTDAVAQGHGETAMGSLVDVNSHTAVNMPDGYHLSQVDGKWELFDSHNSVVDGNVTFDDQGKFSEATQHLLNEKGFKFSDDVRTIHDPNTTSYSDVHVSPHEFIANHSKEFTHVQRDLWYDNNTPNVYDDNELKLQWGGVNGTGMDAHGNYVFNMANMNPDGSFHDGLSANAQHLIREGKMKIALSLTQGTQSHVVMVSVNEHGQAVIPHDSPIGGALFTHHNGQAQFVGGYAEAVQLGSVHNGVQSVNMLATVVGENHPNPNGLVELVPHIHTHSHEQVINTLMPPVSSEATPSLIEVPPAIPLRSRGGLKYAGARSGEGATRAPAEDGYYNYYRNSYSPESLQRYELYRSPRLQADPEARLDTGEEVAWYRNKLLDNPDGDEYLRQIGDVVQSTPELKEMDANTRALVCIPVGATSEADNIYNTLSLYAQQPEETQKQTKILLHVNWFDDAATDPAKKQKIDKTLAEIERAKADFPSLSVASFETEWERATYGSNGIIYHVVNKLYDTALESIHEAVIAGQMPSDHEVLIIRNDADPLGMAKDYLSKEIGALDKYPDSDAYVSAIRQGTERHRQYPGFGVVTNMAGVMDQVKSLLRKPVATIGINTAIRASTLAAIGGIRRDDGYTGAGSDDIEIGSRVYSARQPDRYTPIATPSGGYTVGQVATGATTGALRSSYVARHAADPDEETASPPIAYVRGAHIDSSPDRLLNTYRQLKPVTESWAGFDTNGHVDRTKVGEGNIKLNGESTRVINGTARRIEQNYTAMFNFWAGGDKDVIRLALGFAHGEGDDIYTVTWNADGSCEFKFTDKGRDWLKNKLERDGQGRKEHFGDRVRRQLYHEVKPRSRKRPASSRPRFVKPSTGV